MNASGKQLKCVVVTPEEALLDEHADFVVVPMFDGELGILPGHTPLIGRLGAGEMRLQQGAAVRRFYVDAGFVQVRGDEVTLLTQKAIPAENINKAKVEADATAALPHSDSLAEHELANKARERARAMLHIARKI